MYGAADAPRRRDRAAASKAAAMAAATEAAVLVSPREAVKELTTPGKKRSNSRSPASRDASTPATTTTTRVSPSAVDAARAAADVIALGASPEAANPARGTLHANEDRMWASAKAATDAVAAAVACADPAKVHDAVARAAAAHAAHASEVATAAGKSAEDAALAARLRPGDENVAIEANIAGDLATIAADAARRAALKANAAATRAAAVAAADRIASASDELRAMARDIELERERLREALEDAAAMAEEEEDEEEEDDDDAADAADARPAPAPRGELPPTPTPNDRRRSYSDDDDARLGRLPATPPRATATPAMDRALAARKRRAAGGVGGSGLTPPRSLGKPRRVPMSPEDAAIYDEFVSTRRRRDVRRRAEEAIERAAEAAARRSPAAAANARRRPRSASYVRVGGGFSNDDDDVARASASGSFAPGSFWTPVNRHTRMDISVSAAEKALLRNAGAFYTLVPIRPRSRGERHSLRNLPGVSLSPPSLSIPALDAFQLQLTPMNSRTKRSDGTRSVVETERRRRRDERRRRGRRRRGGRGAIPVDGATDEEICRDRGRVAAEAARAGRAATRRRRRGRGTPTGGTAGDSPPRDGDGDGGGGGVEAPRQRAALRDRVRDGGEAHDRRRAVAPRGLVDRLAGEGAPRRRRRRRRRPRSARGSRRRESARVRVRGEGPVHARDRGADAEPHGAASRAREVFALQDVRVRGARGDDELGEMTTVGAFPVFYIRRRVVCSWTCFLGPREKTTTTLVEHDAAHSSLARLLRDSSSCTLPSRIVSASSASRPRAATVVRIASPRPSSPGV